MATLEYEFNTEEHGEMQSFDPVAPGKYEAMVIESELKPTQNGDFNQLKLTWQITVGEFEGRKVWSRVNLPNRSYPVESLPDNKKQAIDIGGKELATICRAVGKPRIADSAELHNIPIVIDVRIKPEGKGKDGKVYPAGNEIKGYAPIDGVVAAASSTATPRTPVTTTAKAPAAKPAGTPPWARK